MMTAKKTDAEAALSTILARVRCEAVHAQTNGGRCVSCISWARNIGAPAHMPRLAPVLAEVWAEGFKQGGPMHDENYDDPDAHTRNPYSP